MRRVGLVVLTTTVSCHGGPATTPKPAKPTAVEGSSPTGETGSNTERLATDTAKTTVDGHTFTAPAGWSVSVRGRATIMTAPEGRSDLALVDVHAEDAAQAVEAAWTEYGRAEAPPLEGVERFPDRDGWTDIRRFRYQVAPNEGRFLVAEAGRTGDAWQVVLVDMSNAVGEKRQSELLLMFEGRFPKGYTPESFAGKTPNDLDDAHITELTDFVEMARTELGVPGVSVGVVQDGKVVFLGGFGVRQVGRPAKVDGDTKFWIGSTTKPLTTLMLASLVDEKRIAWDSPVSDVMPSFRLSSAELTAKVQVRHLLCACTGLPRQDYEFTFEFRDLTPRRTIDALATMQPTSGFGEVYQYSNPLAAAAGFVGGHVAYPKLELGEAYDEAMRSRVFEPLGMTATTFDLDEARRGNWARPHEPDLDGTMALTDNWFSDAIVPLRPAGGAWSTARDLLAVVSMELAEGRRPNGDRYLSKDNLLARREPQIATGNDGTYGMGLEVLTRFGVTIVHHGGAADGYYSDMMWLPEHGVGSVVLTNGAPGWALHGAFQRKLLEVLFDGEPHADADVVAEGRSFYERIAAERARLDLPAAPEVVAELAAVYDNDALGEITVRRDQGTVVFDFGEWTREVTSSKNPDGTVSMVMLPPTIERAEFVIGQDAGRRTLTLRDYQHEYVFVER